MKAMFWVGRVAFLSGDSPQRVTCAVCKRSLAPARAATHARQRHKSLTDNVLPGQLGLPMTNTPDVPR